MLTTTNFDSMIGERLKDVSLIYKNGNGVIPIFNEHTEELARIYFDRLCRSTLNNGNPIQATEENFNKEVG